MRILRAWIGAVISVAALYLALRGVNFSALWNAFLAADHLLLLAGLLLVCLSIVLRARRWQSFFSDPRSLNLSNLFGVLNVGYLVNNVLPLRAGELVRVVMLGQIERAPSAEILTTIVVERIVDTLSVIVLLGLVAPFIPVPRAAARPVVALGVLMLLFVCGLLLLALKRSAALRLVTWAAQLLPERFRAVAEQQAGKALDGLAALRNPRAAAEVAGLSALIYFTLGAAMAAQLIAFHVRLGVAASYFVLAAATLGLVVPASPGAIGVWEAVIIATLTGIFGVDRTPATGVALVTHVIFFAPPMFFGAAYLWRVGVSWGRVFSLRPARPAEESLR
jgi:glycosyltransferase 2 family protein